MVNKKEEKLVTALKIFIGYIKRNGATEEEMKTMVRTVYLIEKYLPHYKNEMKEG